MEGNIYERLLGIRPTINAAGPLSRYGASLMPPEVTGAMTEASHHFVDLDELNRTVGRRIAEIMNAEAAMVTSGAFGAMKLGAAACLTGSDPERMAQLPAPTWLRRECLIQTAHTFVYDRAYTDAGMKLVPVETDTEMRAAIGERTAMIAGLANVERWNRPGVLLPEDLVAIGREGDVPVLIDAAAEVPPASNLTYFTEIGVDLVAISGGKGLRGPSSTGILAGRADLVEAAQLQASPNARIGRGMKVDKEEMIGLLVALERFVELDHAAVAREERRKAAFIAAQLADVAGLDAVYDEALAGGVGVILRWDEGRTGFTAGKLVESLAAGDPPVVLWTFEILNYTGEPTVYTSQLPDGDEIRVARRLRQVFTARLNDDG